MQTKTHAMPASTTRIPEAGHPSSSLLPQAAVLGAVFFWGGSFAAMKSAVDMMGPCSMMWVRMAIALAILLPFAGKLKPRNYQKGDWKILGALVLFQPCLYFLFESNALCYTTSSQAGLIVACVPLLVTVAARFFYSEQVSSLAWKGLVMTIGGVAWLTWVSAPSENAVNPLLGNGLEILATFCATGYMLTLKKLSGRYNPWTLAGLQALAGTLFFIPGAPTVLAGGYDAWSWEQTLALVYLGVFASLGAFALYGWAMARLTPTQASVYINLVPVVAVLVGWVILNETLNASQLTASMGIVAGVFLCQVASNKKRAQSG